MNNKRDINKKKIFLTVAILVILVAVIVVIILNNQTKVEETISNSNEIVTSNTQIDENEEKIWKELMTGISSTKDMKDYNPKLVLKYTSRNDKKINEIYDMGDHKIKTFGGDASVVIDNKEYSLAEALNNKIISENDILEQLQYDLEYGVCTKLMYYDGGSTEYNYSDYTVLKLNAMPYGGDIDKDLVIGMSSGFLREYSKIK